MSQAPVSLQGSAGVFAVSGLWEQTAGTRLQSVLPRIPSTKGLYGGRIGRPRDWVAQRPRPEAVPFQRHWRRGKRERCQLGGFLSSVGNQGQVG